MTDHKKRYLFQLNNPNYLEIHLGLTLLLYSLMSPKLQNRLQPFLVNHRAMCIII